MEARHIGCLVGIAALALCLVGCKTGSGGGTALAGPTTTIVRETGPDACPVEGCAISILDVKKHGDELQLRVQANFTPVLAHNHIDVYWDVYTADQVSGDAATRGVTKGKWMRTADYPLFVTAGAVSTRNRQGSTKICVTASDRDDDVIDASIANCRDVTALL
jgi:hypothetical protein